MIKSYRPKQRISAKTRPAISTQKNLKIAEKDISPHSTKHSAPSAHTPTNKNMLSQAEHKKSETSAMLSTSSLEDEEIIQMTNSVKNQVLSGMEELKSTSNAYIHKNSLLQQEVEQIQDNFWNVKNNVNDIYWESYKSKDSMMKVKNFFETPKQRTMEDVDFDLSSVQSENYEEVFGRLKTLQGQILEMKQQIESNEIAIKNKEVENNELINTVYRLRNSLNGENLSCEREESHSSCTQCSLF